MLEKIFKLKEHNTNVKTEIIAGITTFYDNGLHSGSKPKYSFSSRDG